MMRSRVTCDDAVGQAGSLRTGGHPVQRQHEEYL
jgi:hypothetical protein